MRALIDADFDADQALADVREQVAPTEAILRTAAQRMRPVLLTSITTVLGLLPMVFAVNTVFSCLLKQDPSGSPTRTPPGCRFYRNIGLAQAPDWTNLRSTFAEIPTWCCQGSDDLRG